MVVSAAWPDDAGYFERFPRMELHAYHDLPRQAGDEASEFPPLSPAETL